MVTVPVAISPGCRGQDKCNPPNIIESNCEAVAYHGEIPGQSKGRT